jgi:hypothetical protein
VTFDVTKAVKELKAGKIEFRVDKGSNVHAPVGKASFTEDKLLENTRTFLRELLRAKPPAAKGHYLKSLTLSSTMGPGITLDTTAVRLLLEHGTAPMAPYFYALYGLTHNAVTNDIGSSLDRALTVGVCLSEGPGNVSRVPPAGGLCLDVVRVHDPLLRPGRLEQHTGRPRRARPVVCGRRGVSVPRRPDLPRRDFDLPSARCRIVGRPSATGWGRQEGDGSR